MTETSSHAELVGPFPSRLGNDASDIDLYDRLRRRVLWALPSGLYLVGSAAKARRNLMTARWVTQLSLRPKLVGVSVEATSVTHGLILEGGCFSASCIHRDDRAMVRRFVKPAEEGPGEGQLSGVEVMSALTGAPIPTSAVGWVDCRLTQTVSLGSHSLFIGEVVDAGGDPGEDRPLLRLEDTRMNYGG